MATMSVPAEDEIAITNSALTQVIRKQRTLAPWKVGQTIFFKAGAKPAREFGRAVITSVVPIVIHTSGVRLDGHELQPREIVDLAKATGYQGSKEMFDFYLRAFKMPYEAVLIKWAGFLST